MDDQLHLAPPSEVFHPILPGTLRDERLSPTFAHLRETDPDILDAVADVDRSLIWSALAEAPAQRMARAVGLAQMVEAARLAR